jgi:hypothetical protein
VSYFVDVRDAERQYARVKAERDEARAEVRRLNQLAGIYGSALDEIAQETGTPYGTAAQKALDDAAAFDRHPSQRSNDASSTGPSPPLIRKEPNA